MVAVKKTEKDQSPYDNLDDIVSPYDNLDDIVRELTALREQADQELPGPAREATPEPRREPPGPAARPPATIRQLRVAGRDGSEPRPLPVVPAPEQVEAAPPPQPPLQHTPSRPSSPDNAYPLADPLPAFLRSVRDAEEAEQRRRKPILFAVIGTCAASVVALGIGAYTFVGGGGDRLAGAHSSALVETGGTTLTGSMLLQAAQRRSAPTVEPSPPSAEAPAVASTRGEATGWERASIEGAETERPRGSETVLAPRSAAPAAEQQVAALVLDERPQAPLVATTTTAAAPAVGPATPPSAPAAPVASAQPEPAAAASAPQSETQTAALPSSPVPAPPVPQRPRFSAEETGRLIARGRAMIDTTADIAGARLLLQRAMDMGDPAAAFALAETFDPNVLSRTRVFGIRADAAVARRLYQQALDGGVEDARPRLVALGN